MEIIETLKGLGPLGDFFGGILNPIISGAALFLLYKTFNLQKTELEETRKLVKEQAEETKKQSEVLKTQSEMAAKQNDALSMQAVLNYSYGQIEILKHQIELEYKKIELISNEINQLKQRNILISSRPGNLGTAFQSNQVFIYNGLSITTEKALEEIKNIHTTIEELNKEIEKMKTATQRITNIFVGNEP